MNKKRSKSFKFNIPLAYLSVICICINIMLVIFLYFSSKNTPLEQHETEDTSVATAVTQAAISTEISSINATNSDYNLIPQKKYKIEKEVPKPDPSKFITLTTGEASKINSVISQAKAYGLLANDEKTIFSDKAPFLNWASSNIQYYLDESILVILWKEEIDGQYMTFSEIKIADASQFRRKIADDTYGSSKQYFCSELTKQVNSVVSMNADFYTFRNAGITVYNGKVHRTDNTLDTLFIDGNGDFKYFEKNTKKSKEELQSYIDDNNINFSLSFGPILVKNHTLMDFVTYPIGQNNEKFSRTCICQVDTLHYLYANAGYLSAEKSGATTKWLAKCVYDKGVKEAYMLDGGQTSEIIFNGKIFNLLSYNDERTVSDIIYFATAVQR